MPKDKIKRPEKKIDIKELLAQKPIPEGAVSNEIIEKFIDPEKRPKPNRIPLEQDLIDMRRAGELLKEINIRKK